MREKKPATKKKKNVPSSWCRFHFDVFLQSRSTSDRKSDKSVFQRRGRIGVKTYVDPCEITSEYPLPTCEASSDPLLKSRLRSGMKCVQKRQKRLQSDEKKCCTVNLTSPYHSFFHSNIQLHPEQLN